jgi:beta-galactosidase
LFDDALTTRLFEQIAQRAGVETMQLGESVRISRRGALTYVFNYGDTAHTITGAADNAFVIGSRAVEPQGVAVYRAG